MRAGDLFVDMSEVLAHPLRSGIQRVMYQLLRSWPDPDDLVIGIIDGNGEAWGLPRYAASALTAAFEISDPLRVERRFRRLVARARPLRAHPLERFPAILVPEVFFVRARCTFYERVLRQSPDRVFFICYDLLPWLRPEFFPGWGLSTAPYLRLLRNARNVAFISDRSRQDLVGRLRRREGDNFTVVPLGADGLGRRAPRFVPESRRFVSVGTVEPRKRHDVMLDAFSELWADGVDAELTIVGRPGWAGPEVLDRLDRHAREGRIRWLRDVDDFGMRDTVSQARATLYVSAAEGFGLPVMESLALGVPAIVDGVLPCLTGLGPQGQIRLDEVTPRAVAAAVRRMLDEQFAKARTEEITELDLPRWADFGPAVAGWVARTAEPSPALAGVR